MIGIADRERRGWRAAIDVGDCERNDRERGGLLCAAPDQREVSSNLDPRASAIVAQRAARRAAGGPLKAEAAADAGPAAPQAPP